MNSTPPLAFDAAPVTPLDAANQTLLSHVSPQDWQNPTPAGCYDLVVIGAGTAGLVVAAGAAGLDLGLKVALIERHLMGGDCLNVGCIPSKCLIRSGRVAADMRQSLPFGVQPPAEVAVDFGSVMARMRQLRAGISHHDSAQRFQGLGVDVFLGGGQFLQPGQIQVGSQVLAYKKAVIATGARAVRPNIPGLDQVGYLTNETVFNLTEAPRRLAVIGGGPIGCELAQVFQRLGSQVVLFHRGNHVLHKEDADAAALVQGALVRDGVELVLQCQLQQVEVTPEGKRLTYSSGENTGTIVVDEILAGAGRAPNVEGLNLEAVGVQYDRRRGVVVNDYLQTSNPQIYAAGDICMDWKFTHAADAAARIVLKNTLFSPWGLGRARLSDLVMPWATYTDPEVAQAGLSEQDARHQGIAVDTIYIDMAKVDRAIADGETEGFVKIHHKRGSDQILGATIVARHGGDMISEITTAMVHNLGLSKLSSVIHPYPTQAEAIKKAADAYRRTLLTPKTKKFLKLLTRFS
ncbi:mercuric reductase [Prochlorothrix hollandica]|uniref:mercuric reductase n=1 Tax=Prochlorothrix hollandica TaxID=1223 RepID=UPI003342375B